MLACPTEHAKQDQRFCTKRLEVLADFGYIDGYKDKVKQQQGYQEL
jgi:hypothetical protein